MKPKTIIIIGGLSAGPAAAARARRMDETAHILLFEKTKYISYATCGMPYALSGVIASRNKLLVVRPELLEKRFKIETHLEEEVTLIEPDSKKIKTNKGEYTYDKLIYAGGATPIMPPVENLSKSKNHSFLRTLEDFDRLTERGVLANAKRIVVLGGGLIGVEAAENLREMGKEVRIIEGGSQILPQWSESYSSYAAGILEEQEVRVHTGQFLTRVEIDTDSQKLTHLVLQNGETFEADYLILATGIKPNSPLLKEVGVLCDSRGAILVNEKMETNLPDIYAAGDCASMINPLTNEPDYFPMGTHSNKGGRTAGSQAAGGDDQIKGGYGTAIVKIFEFTLARTGYTRKQLEDKAIAFERTFVNAPATPGYYPDSKEILLDIYYEKESGRLLAAEALGEKGIDKRIDVLSTCLYAGLSVDDLPRLDLAYAPPYSPAKDPITVAGFVASNHRRAHCSPMRVEELAKRMKSNKPFTLVDLRTPSEIKKTDMLPGAINIELDSLRSRLDELNKNDETVIYCAKGIRGYLGALILRHNGFTNVKNLAGGYSALRNRMNE